MTIETIVTEKTQAMYDNFHFAEATVSEGFVFCSGVIGSGANGKIPDDPAEEFANAWQGVSEALEAAGSSLDNIVEYTSYHVGLQQHMGAFMAARDGVLSAPWPAWTAIGITELAIPGARVEIRVTARLK